MIDFSTTHIRIAKPVLAALRLAAGELTTALRSPIASDSETIAALLQHWDRTKLECYAMRSGPVLVNGATEADELTAEYPQSPE